MSTLPPFVTPTQGLLGGLGLALSASLLLFSNGAVLGVGGFIHRAFDLRSPLLTGWTNGRLADILGVAGLISGGVLVGALESLYIPDSTPFQPKIGLDILKVAAAGFLVGLGSKLQNGCTSGHMICGVSRFSWRSIIATMIFFPVASLTSQLHRNTLPTIAGYDWSIGPVGASLVGTQAVLLLPTATVLLFASQSVNRISSTATKFLQATTTFVSALLFALALRLSTLSSPNKVLSFLITPFSDPGIFDSSLLFVAITSIPASALLYQLATFLRRPQPTRVTGKELQPPESERSPLVTRKEEDPTSTRAKIPILASYKHWPGVSAANFDARLVIGAILFGVGWGMEGTCPGPGLLNLGRSIFLMLLHGKSPELGQWSVWFVSCVVGGLVAL